MDRTGRTQTDALSEGDRWIDSFVPYQLYRVTNRLNAKLMGRLKLSQITPSQWRVLSVLKAYGRLSVGRIVDYTLMEQPTVSRVVAQLEEDGHVARRWSESDSRVMEVTLTRMGAAAFDDIHPTALRHQELAFKGFSEDDIATLCALLGRVEQNLEYYD
jgi:DNA-binding MarR family transcriptional regulator